MKLNAFAVLSLGILASLASVGAKADQPYRGYRYQTTYSQWDAGFAGYYGYSETCTRVYNGYGVMHTCYDSGYFTPSTPVYIEELRTQGGYERIRVYRGSDDSIPYVTYYVYDDGSTRRVEERQFYSDTYFPQPYYSTYYTTETEVWNTTNFDKGWENVMVGAFSIDLGAAVLANSTNTTETLLGLGSLAFGSSSIAKGQKQIEQSSLETVIVQKTYYGGTDIQ